MLGHTPRSSRSIIQISWLDPLASSLGQFSGPDLWARPLGQTSGPDLWARPSWPGPDRLALEPLGLERGRASSCGGAAATVAAAWAGALGSLGTAAPCTRLEQSAAHVARCSTAGARAKPSQPTDPEGATSGRGTLHATAAREGGAPIRRERALHRVSFHAPCGLAAANWAFCSALASFWCLACHSL